MQLSVFAAANGDLYLQISSPALVYKRHLFVPMLPEESELLAEADLRSLVTIWYAGKPYKVPYLLVSSENVLGTG